MTTMVGAHPWARLQAVASAQGGPASADPASRWPPGSTARETPEWNVARLLQEATALHPDRPACIRADGHARYTFSALTQRAAAAAAGLLCHGLQPGDRVAVLVRDREEALVPAIAALWAGATLVVPPANHGLRLALALAGLARPSAVIADPSLWVIAAAFPGLRRAPIRVSAGRLRWPGLLALDVLANGAVAAAEMPAAGSRSVAADPVARPLDAPALITWTTGTTGRPHPVVRSHGVLAAQHSAIRRLRTPRPADVDLAGLPNIVLHDLACGVAVVMPPPVGADRDGGLLRAAVVRCGATTAAGFPALFERLAQGAPPGALPLLRSIHVGGAPVRPDLLDRIARVAPNARVTVVYGATEVEPIAAIDAAEMRHALSQASPGSGLPVGRLWEGLELRLVSDQPERAPTRGRILVSGARVAPDADRSDSEGWLDTGDVGSMDDGGRLWLLGRGSNGMVSGPHSSDDVHFPAEIEGPVAALEGVGAAALVSLPGRGRSRAVLAVEPADWSTGARTRAEVASLAHDRRWQLDRILLVRRLPRDGASGKIDYRRLRALVR